MKRVRKNLNGFLICKPWINLVRYAQWEKLRKIIHGPVLHPFHWPKLWAALVLHTAMEGRQKSSPFIERVVQNGTPEAQELLVPVSYLGRSHLEKGGGSEKRVIKRLPPITSSSAARDCVSLLPSAYARLWLKSQNLVYRMVLIYSTQATWSK